MMRHDNQKNNCLQIHCDNLKCTSNKTKRTSTLQLHTNKAISKLRYIDN